VPVLRRRKTAGKGDEPWRALAGPHRRDLAVGGSSVHYIDMGRGRPVLLIHGLADSTYAWHRNVPALVESGLRVILVDQPGMGLSGAPPAPYRYSVENQASAVRAVADHLNLGRFDLVGSSMGGGVALYLAWKLEARVRSVTAIAPVCYRVGRHGFMAMPGARFLARIVPGRWLVRRMLEDIYFDPGLLNGSLIDEYCLVLRRSGFIDAVVSMRLQYFSDEFDRMAARYERMRTPLLIVWGDHDRWVSRRYGQRLHEAVPGSRFEIIEKAGHVPHQERPGAFNRLLVDFLGSCEHGPGSNARHA
jgi:pimeloyl-ACP methyl ester carboxylesterase